MSYSGAYVSNALVKMINNEMPKLDDDVATLENDLRELEKKYAMSSVEFFEKFQRGHWVMKWILSNGRLYIKCIKPFSKRRKRSRVKIESRFGQSPNWAKHESA